MFISVHWQLATFGKYAHVSAGNLILVPRAHDVYGRDSPTFVGIKSCSFRGREPRPSGGLEPPVFHEALAKC